MALDLETLLLVGAALTGIVVGVLHLVGYVPPRYRRMLSEVQHSTAVAITETLEARLAPLIGNGDEDGPDPLGELPRILQELPIKIGEQLTASLSKAQDQAMAELQKAGQLPPEVTGAIGGTIRASNQRTHDLKEAIGQGVLGPYGGILQQVMPPLYDYLSENPDMAIEALQMPVVQKLIQQGARMLGKVTGGENSGGGGWL